MLNTYLFFIVLFLFYFFNLFSVASGLSCGTQDLSLWRSGSLLVAWGLECMGSVVVARELFVARRLQTVWALYLWRMGSRVHGLCSCSMQAL